MRKLLGALTVLGSLILGVAIIACSFIMDCVWFLACVTVDGGR